MELGLAVRLEVALKCSTSSAVISRSPRSPKNGTSQFFRCLW